MESINSAQKDDNDFLEQQLFANEQLSGRSDESEDFDDDEDEDDEEDDDEEDDDDDDEEDEDIKFDDIYVNDNNHKNNLSYDIYADEDSAIGSFQEVLGADHPIDRCSTEGSDSGFSSEVADNSSNEAIKKSIQQIATTIAGSSTTSIAAAAVLTTSESDRKACFLGETALNTEGYDFVNNLLAEHAFVTKSSLKRPHPDDDEFVVSSKKKRSIQFDNVTVYYFARVQGFTCIPSQGGSTLGMSSRHVNVKRFSLAEHAIEQKKLHRHRLQYDKITPVNSNDELSENDNDSEHGGGVGYYLQPVPLKKRRALLRAAGVKVIDRSESLICRKIRRSREVCGCSCKVYCDPDSCSCSQAGIKCQVDRSNFPCGCVRDNCANSSGRIEFNPFRVKTHFIHTLMRLELEKNAHKHHEPSGSAMHSWHSNDQRRSTTQLDRVRSSPTSFAHQNQDEFGAMNMDLYSIREDCFPSSVMGEIPISSSANNTFSFVHNSSPYSSSSTPSTNSFYQSSPMMDFQSVAFSSFSCNYDSELDCIQNQNQNQNQQSYDSMSLNQSNAFECYNNPYYPSEPQSPCTSSAEVTAVANTPADLDEQFRNNNIIYNVGNNLISNSNSSTAANHDCDSDNFAEIIKKSMVESVLT